MVSNLLNHYMIDEELNRFYLRHYLLMYKMEQLFYLKNHNFLKKY